MKHIATFLYGSQVYGTQDEESDIDYIVIVDKLDEEGKQTLTDNVSITYYSAEYFQRLFDEHDVAAIECYMLPDHLKLGDYRRFKFKPDLVKLRHSFSAVASNSWVKAKKKINKEKEYRIGIKSLFHSLRILRLGITIAVDANMFNDKLLWKRIKSQNFETWKEYKDYWQPIYNELKSEFKKVAPLNKEIK